MFNEVADRHWFVIQTRAGMEKTADKGIEKLRFEHYLPVYRRPVCHAGRREEVTRPLFPLYTFARFSLLEDYGRILRERGVTTILGINRLPGCPTKLTFDDVAKRRPIPLSDEVIEKIRENEISNHGFVDQSKPKEKITPGMTVKILDGPFSDFEGLVDRDHRKRVWVLLDILGRENAIPFQRDSLEIVRQGGGFVSPVRRDDSLNFDSTLRERVRH